MVAITSLVTLNLGLTTPGRALVGLNAAGARHLAGGTTSEFLNWIRSHVIKNQPASNGPFKSTAAAPSPSPIRIRSDQVAAYRAVPLSAP